MPRGCAPPTCQRLRNALRLAMFLVSTLPSAAHGIQWPQLSLAPAITGVSLPTHIAHAGDGSGRLFVVEQRGNIRIVKNGVLQNAAFLDISSRLSCCGERGLLSVAFPPAYAGKGYFFVYYTNTLGDIVVARYSVTTNPDVADPNSEAIVLTVPHPTNANHNGGQLAFGPDDGDLYIGTGDGGSGGDPPNNAQNTNVLLGKILRIDVLSGTGAPYAIPAGNPYAQVSGYRPEIWAFGMRNPWRFSFDRLTHDLYIADVGQGSYEEIDYQPAGNPGGQNYGWRIMEGLHCYNAATCNMAGLTLPVAEYSHAQGDCSVTGGFVYRGQQFPRMQGIYFYGDYCTGRIWGLQRDGGAWVNMLLYDAPFNITTFGEDEAGNLYVANATNGAIAMLTDSSAPTATLTGTTTAALTPTRSQTMTPVPTNTATLVPTSTPTRSTTRTATASPTATTTPALTQKPSPTPTTTMVPVCISLAPSGLLGSVQSQNLQAGCTSNWQCALMNDGDTTYVYSSPTGAIGPRTDLYAIDDLVPRAEPIVAVHVRIVSRSLMAAAGSSAAAQLKLASNPTIFSGAVLQTTVAYSEAVSSFPTNPAAGRAWSWSDINTLQAGVRHQVAAGDEVRTTQVAVDVCWLPGPGAGTLSIDGQIVYAGSGLPVSGATVQLFGPTPGAVQTNAAGHFTFTGLSSDAWSIQPRKFEPKSNALNAADAVAVLQAVVGIRSLDAVQLLACDVNGDGRPTASDAVLVLMYNVEIISSFPTAQRCGSDWIFVPQPQDTANQGITPASLAAGACQPGSIAWTPLAGPVTNQSFVAVLIGDCSGNWQPGTP